MRPGRTLALFFLFLTMLSAASGGNPFLDANDDKPRTARFVGTEWGDEIEEEESPLSATVVTTRIAKMAWGAVFKIEFQNIKSKAAKPRTLGPDYFVVTDNAIVLLNEADNEAATRSLAAASAAPKFDPTLVYGISKGKRDGPNDKLVTRKREVKGDLSTYTYEHNSGHFTRIVWKRGAGLVEYSAGYGARADGYKLAREKSGKGQ